MVNKSIAYRLSFFVSIAVILVFIAFIFAYFTFNQQLLRENIENKAIGLSAEVSALINREVNSIVEVTANLAEQVDYYHQHGDVNKLITPVVTQYPYLLSVQVYLDTSYSLPYHFFSVTKNGNRIEYKQQESPHFGSITEKRTFDKALNSNSPIWSDPFLAQGNNEAFITYYRPFNIDSAGGAFLRGLISGKLSLTLLSDTINRVKVGKRGYAFLADKNGKFMTHPENRKIFNSNFLISSKKARNSNSQITEKFFSERERGSAIIYPELLDYEKSWVYFSFIPNTRWYLVYVMPYHELYRELYAVTFRMSVFALIGIVLIYFLVSYIIKRQIKPLSTITSKLTSFSSPFKLNTKNEVKQVANSLEYLKVWFEQYQVARQKEELNNFQHNRDLHQASEIQQSLIKTSFPAFPNRTDIDLYAIYKPAQIVSGDLFDYYFIDDDNLMFTIGDVSGKGIPAAIFMSVCQTVIRNNAHFRYPNKIVEITNSELCTSNNHQYFLTLFLGVLNVKTGILTYCNAAHTFPYILKSSGKLNEIQSTHGLPLGLYSKKEYGEEKIHLESGDSIILYTDGVFVALNEKNMLLGSQFFKESLKNKKNLSPKKIIDLLDNDLAKKEILYKDDICILAIKLLS